MTRPIRIFHFQREPYSGHILGSSKFQIGVLGYDENLQHYRLATVQGKTLGEALAAGYLEGRKAGYQYAPMSRKEDKAKHLDRIKKYCFGLKATFVTKHHHNSGAINYMNCGDITVRFQSEEEWRALMYACRTLKIKFKSARIATHHPGQTLPWKVGRYWYGHHDNLPEFLTFEHGLAAIMQEKILDTEFEELASTLVEASRFDYEEIQTVLRELPKFLPKGKPIADDVRRMEI